MGILQDQYPRADYGNECPFETLDDALLSIDPDNPPIGSTFRISGKIYQLQLIYGNLNFLEVS